MSDSKNTMSMNVSEPIKKDVTARPLRAWHIMYTLLGIFVVVLFVVGGLLLVLYETSPMAGGAAGLAVALLLLYGAMAVAILGAVALLTLPFYIMARKKVAHDTAVVPQKKVRVGVIAAVIIFGSVAALVALVSALLFGF